MLDAGHTAIRMHHHGWEYAIDPWNIFDYCLVVPWQGLKLMDHG